MSRTDSFVQLQLSIQDGKKQYKGFEHRGICYHKGDFIYVVPRGTTEQAVVREGKGKHKEYMEPYTIYQVVQVWEDARMLGSNNVNVKLRRLYRTYEAKEEEETKSNKRKEDSYVDTRELLWSEDFIKASLPDDERWILEGKCIVMLRDFIPEGKMDAYRDEDHTFYVYREFSKKKKQIEIISNLEALSASFCSQCNSLPERPQVFIVCFFHLFQIK